VREPAPYDHYEPRGTDPDVALGVYRVVGTDDPIAFLRVTDRDGRRRATGEVVRVSREDLAEGFEPTANPDTGIDPIGTLRNLASGVAWSVRRLL
jgi:hypothetical protein